MQQRRRQRSQAALQRQRTHRVRRRAGDRGVEFGATAPPEHDRLDEFAHPQPEQQLPDPRRDRGANLLDRLHKAVTPVQRDAPGELRREPAQHVRVVAFEVTIEARDGVVVGTTGRCDPECDQLAERIRALLEPIRVDEIRPAAIGRFANLALELGMARLDDARFGFGEVSIDELVEQARRRVELRHLCVRVEPVLKLATGGRSLQRLDELREIAPDDLEPTHFDLLGLHELPDQLPGGDDAIHGGARVLARAPGGGGF